MDNSTSATPLRSAPVVSQYGVKVCPTCGHSLDKPIEQTSSFGDLRLDLSTFVAFRGVKRIKFTPREGRLLEYLMRHPGQTKTRTQIMEGAWGLNCDALLTNQVDVYINYLRAKLDSGFEEKLIHTNRGVGYMFGGHRSQR